jgi:hypothetical protein
MDDPGVRASGVVEMFRVLLESQDLPVDDEWALFEAWRMIQVLDDGPVLRYLAQHGLLSWAETSYKARAKSKVK